jgi:hypothetical protein
MRRIPLPEPVARIYRATADLEALYPGRKFTPDGHLVGSIGEVIAAKALGLTLHPMSRSGHDGYDANGEVQIKMTAGKRVALYATCERLVCDYVPGGDSDSASLGSNPGPPANREDGKSGACRVIEAPCLRSERLRSERLRPKPSLTSSPPRPWRCSKVRARGRSRLPTLLAAVRSA